MQRKIAYAVLLAVFVPAVIAGCAASRTYSEGILATERNVHVHEELRAYGMKLDQEDRTE